MKRLVSVLVVLGAIGACAPAPATPPAQDTAADVAMLNADAMTFFDLFTKGDADGVANLYAEDAVVMPPGVPAVHGRAAIRDFMAGFIAEAKAAGLSLRNGTSTSGVSGDLGWITGSYTVVDATGATVDSGNYMSLHRRANGSWPYIRDTWNSDRPPAPAAAPGK